MMRLYTVSAFWQKKFLHVSMFFFCWKFFDCLYAGSKIGISLMRFFVWNLSEVSNWIINFMLEPNCAYKLKHLFFWLHFLLVWHMWTRKKNCLHVFAVIWVAYNQSIRNGLGRILHQMWTFLCTSQCSWSNGVECEPQKCANLLIYRERPPVYRFEWANEVEIWNEFIWNATQDLIKYGSSMRILPSTQKHWCNQIEKIENLEHKKRSNTFSFEFNMDAIFFASPRTKWLFCCCVVVSLVNVNAFDDTHHAASLSIWYKTTAKSWTALFLPHITSHAEEKASAFFLRQRHPYWLDAFFSRDIYCYFSWIVTLTRNTMGSSRVCANIEVCSNSFCVGVGFSAMLEIGLKCERIILFLSWLALFFSARKFYSQKQYNFQISLLFVFFSLSIYYFCGFCTGIMLHGIEIKSACFVCMGVC